MLPILRATGVTIPSQRRYVEYYSTLVQEQLEYHPVSLIIQEIHLEPLPTFNGGQVSLQLVISEASKRVFSSGVYEIKKGSPNFQIRLDQYIPIQGDIKIEFFNKPKMMIRKVCFFRLLVSGGSRWVEVVKGDSEVCSVTRGERRGTNV
uniref:C2 tensin-type domain-containing protein n=1 Tax=Timema monikensis TaxID=170555 RepID=A0A7R9EKH1_9NEOP|nr:unnamed protein product [Timema monikensis]